MARTRFVAEGAVRGHLYHIDWYPGFVVDENAGMVKGEIFMADGATMNELDDFEGGEYRRVKIAVEVGEEIGAGSVLEAWIWEWLGEAREEWRIVSGDWLAEV